MRLIAILFLLAFSPVFLGCPSGTSDGGGPVEECTQAGQQCKMGGGQLGVCTSDMNSEPPKLFCMSQH